VKPEDRYDGYQDGGIPYIRIHLDVQISVSSNALQYRLDETARMGKCDIT
jgi:hypothetical protein